jgi:hypothetical protein
MHDKPMHTASISYFIAHRKQQPCMLRIIIKEQTTEKRLKQDMEMHEFSADIVESDAIRAHN